MTTCAVKVEEAEKILERRWIDGTGDDAIVLGDHETTNVQFDVRGA